MTFKSLPIGARFEFDLEGLPFTYRGAHGPWIKTGPRKYTHAEKGGEFRVGTISAKVVQLNPSVTVFRANAGPHSPVKVRAHRRDMPRPKRKMRKARKNPGTVVLSRRAVSLAYLHAERGHKSPKGTPYIHKFATGVTVQLLSDGSVRLYRPDRKPLWQRFED